MTTVASKRANIDREGRLLDFPHYQYRKFPFSCIRCACLLYMYLIAGEGKSMDVCRNTDIADLTLH